MDKVFIEFDRKRVLRNIILFSLFSVGFTILVYYLIVVERLITSIFVSLTSIGIVIYLIYHFIFSLKKLSKKNRVGLVLDSEGVAFRGNTTAVKVGRIRWEDIDEVYSDKIMGNLILYLRLKPLQTKKYIQHLAEDAAETIIKSGFIISASELSISFEEMKNLISTYHEQYKPEMKLEIND